MDDEKPPVRRLGLKPREVILTDTVSRTGDGTEISIPLMLMENQLAEARLAREGPRIRSEPATAAAESPGEPSVFKQKEIVHTDQPALPGDEEAIAVDDILRQNHAAARASEPELIAMPVRRRSRRSRDFAVILVTAASAAGILATVFRHDLPVIGLALAGIAFATLIFTWILFGVMDKY